MKIKHWGIRKQVLYLVLSCSLITLLVAGGMSLYAMMKTKSEAVNIGIEIGDAAAKDSGEALEKISLESMRGLTHERAKRIDEFFHDLQWDVKVLSNEMTLILSNPQNYPARRVNEPRREDDGKIVPKLQYKAGVDRSALAYEVGLTANAQDLQVRLYDEDDAVGANYIASFSGFNVTTDKISSRRLDSNGNPLPNDYSSRPWYQKAVQTKGLVFSDVFLDAQGRGLSISCAMPYYNASGEMAGVVGEGVTLQTVNHFVETAKFGATGFAFVMDDETGRILFSSKESGDLSIEKDSDLKNAPSLFDSQDATLATAAKNMRDNVKSDDDVLVQIDGKSYYLAYESLENADWSLGIAVSEDEVKAPAKTNREIIQKSTDGFVEALNDSIKLIIIFMLVIFAVLMSLVPLAGNKVADMFTKPLHVLTEGVRDIASGNWDKKIEVDTENEIKHLAVCFNAMTDELKRYTENLTKVTAEKERIATELNVATDIQVSMLPHEFDFGRKDFELYATMNAAKEVGGDFYDFYLLDDNHLVITMADVSGKGVPAALFMVIAKTILKNFAMTMSTPDDFAAVMTCANNQLCQNNDAMMFVTVFMGMLDLKTGEFVYVNGGHNPPVIYHSAENKCDYLKVRKNFVLGGMEDMNYIQEKTTLQRGDMIYLYTDGVTEALNNEKELYGEERLLNCLNSVDKNISVAEILKIVRADVNKHVDGAEQSDDITMLAVKYQ